MGVLDLIFIWVLQSVKNTEQKLQSQFSVNKKVYVTIEAMFVTIVLKRFYKSSKVYIEDSFSSLIPPIFKVHKKNIKWQKVQLLLKLFLFQPIYVIEC